MHNVENTIKANPNRNWSYVFSHDVGRHWIETSGNEGSELHCNRVTYFTTCASLRSDFSMNEVSLKGNAILI